MALSQRHEKRHLDSASFSVAIPVLNNLLDRFLRNLILEYSTSNLSRKSKFDVHGSVYLGNICSIQAPTRCTVRWQKCEGVPANTCSNALTHQTITHTYGCRLQLELLRMGAITLETCRAKK
jgi:hypothetical protein